MGNTYKHTKLNENEQALLDYIESNAEKISTMTIQMMAKETFTSASTIFRFAKKLGFEGYTEMIYEFAHHHVKYQLGKQDVDVLSEIFLSVFELNKKALDDVKLILNDKNKTIFILGTGYSGIIAEYLYKKLLGKGNNIIFTNGADSSALFVNNLNRIDNLICVSKSGYTGSIIDKANTAQKNNIPVISFTQDNDNDLATISDCTIIIENHNRFDWNNQKTRLFFPILLMIFEYLVEDIIE
ncbi:MurR/RpiR family transcriptional regulator [Tuanshanicoccus lijuaniae]|uniref:MurR/RpiR family transcriptional regulator n=1 Tax=Aerococcaceae bacterium zg-1292 TaxID=2774330 RepID=UPI00193788FA|nr:MurR/RpiR family transcriptional regulator [Aerococcaceae bacterium zg-1292]QQA36853.1 MurR/RpiR family transcriptional regulator [Aerococcaceae bacterium zg-1292]